VNNKTIAIIAGVSLLGIIIWKRSVDADIIEPPDPKVPAGLLGMGDVDMDGWVSQLDYELIKQYISGQVEFTDEQFRRADINKDGEISIMDYSSCMLIAMGKRLAE
jgi:hypothetical protein